MKHPHTTLATLGLLVLSLNACSKSDTAAGSSPAVPPIESNSTAMTDKTSVDPSVGPSVRQQVQVDASGGKVVVSLSVENASAAPVFVPKAVFEDDEIFRREFEITNKATGAEVEYIGPMVKRGPFTRDDYVAVAAGARLANSIDITRSYDFKPGVAYELRYAGAYLGDLARLDAITAVTVAPVSFTFSVP